MSVLSADHNVKHGFFSFLKFAGPPADIIIVEPFVPSEQCPRRTLLSSLHSRYPDSNRDLVITDHLYWPLYYIGKSASHREAGSELQESNLRPLRIRQVPFRWTKLQKAGTAGLEPAAFRLTAGRSAI